MAVAENIVFCMSSSNEKEHGLTATNILLSMNPEYLPGLFSFSVVVTIRDIDITKEHKISIRMFNTFNNDEVINSSNESKTFDKGNSNIPIEYKGINLALSLSNVNFKSSGLYKFVINCDGSDVGEKYIFVKGKNE